MTATLYGLNGLSIVGRKRVTGPQGQSTEVTYKGPLDKMRTEFTARVTSGDQVSFDDRVGGSITITYPDDDGSGGGAATESANSVWEMDSVEIIRPISMHPTFNPNPKDAALDADIQAARKAIATATTFAPTTPVLGQKYYDLLAHGSEEYIVSVPVIKKTVTVGKKSTIVASWTDVDKAVLLSLINPPSALLGTIGNIPGADATKKQWLKKAPQLRGITTSKFEIIYTWWFSVQWSSTLHNGDGPV